MPCRHAHQRSARAVALGLAALCSALVWQTPPAIAQSKPAPASRDAGFERFSGPGAAAVNARLAMLAQACRSEMDLSLDYDPQDIIVTTDFNRDGVIDPILDQALATCGGSSALWSGTGGSPVRIFVSNDRGGWDEHSTGGFFGRVVTINHTPVWLSLVHGTACDGAGALPCAQALIWGDGRFRSVADGKPDPGAD